MGWLCVALLAGTGPAGCGGGSEEKTDPDSGGSTTTGGGDSSGGAIPVAGGAGGTAGDSAATGGSDTENDAPGGAATGGNATGGTATGGNATGGAGTGGAAVGGAAALGGTGGTGVGGATALGGTGGTGVGGEMAAGGTGGSGVGGTDAAGGAAGGGGVGGAAGSSGGAAGVGAASAGSGGTAPAGGSAGVSTGGVTGVTTSLTDYTRTIGPLTLEGPDQASGITHQPETDTFYVVTNTSHRLHEFSTDFSTRLRTISLDNGPTDTEDVAYLGNDRFAIVVEDNEVYVVTIAAGAVTADLGAAEVERYVVSAPPATFNVGFEGVAWQPGVGIGGRFYVCQEGGGNVPIRVLSFLRQNAAGTYDYSNGTLTVDEPWNAVTALGAEMIDLSGVAFDVESNTLLVLSHESSKIVRVVPDTGEILEQRSLQGSPQYEGITFATGGRLVVVSEPNWVEVYALD